MRDLKKYFEQYRYVAPYRLRLYKPDHTQDRFGSHIRDRKSLLLTIRKKKAINKRLRYAVWKEYMGEVYSGLCYCCAQTRIDVTCFQAGHVVAEARGGETTIQNLRPICGLCNQSGSVNHMRDFAMQNGFIHAGIVREQGTFAN
jgi:hypothetical protein